MNNLDLLRMSFGSLLRRKIRAALTILGVVIGTSSIIVMLSLGIAMQTNFKDQLAQMGSLNVIQVYSGAMFGPQQQQQQPLKQSSLDDFAVATFEKIPGVEAVMAEKNVYMKVLCGRMVGGISVIGVNPEVLKNFDFKIKDGRLLSTGDKNAIIFGQQVSSNFYNPRSRNRQQMGPGMTPQVDLFNKKLLVSTDPNFGEVSIDDSQSDYVPPKPYEVLAVGILKESNSEKDYTAYMNLNYLEKIQAEDQKAMHQARSTGANGDKYQDIKVKVADIEQVEAVQNQIKSLGFQTQSLTDILESMKKSSRTMMAILGAIGAVSLFVSALGITNTMIMSIYERTREIGIFKVLGADLVEIKRLFLLEAAMIGFGGGIIGLGLSYLISFILNKSATSLAGQLGGTKVSIISLELGLAAVAFATLVGILSGYAPARRAMKLSALEAIRSE
jgi:ABC-type antimicrobial peptide transport system permease subunit